MKKLTFSSMAAARLRANKRQYVSLVLGIFLSIFLISTLVFSVWGIYQAELQKRYDKVGYLDMVILDHDQMEMVTEEAVFSTGDYDRLGYAYLSGVVTGKNVYVGYYDAVGSELLNLSPVEGRLPESPGEIVLEASAMDVLDVEWSIGEIVELSITPIDGVEETRQYTLVGILPERSIHLERIDYNNIGQFPAIITSSQEQPFDTGRIAYHYVLGFGKNGSISDSLKGFWDYYKGYRVGNAIYGISITGDQVWWYGTADFIQSNREMFVLILMACVLAGSLILSCGIGISGAMEGVLSKRREEIGVLRALGATRRQIRRMFGRENLILALILSPLSILISVGAVWVLSLLMPKNLKFAVNLWLVIPIALFSVVVILISGYLPLVRASKLMPMSVIRDTAMLRRSKGVKSKKEFSATRLIASRQVRFNPTRQIGAALLVGLMLLCSGLVGTLVFSYRDYTTDDSPGFSVDNSYYGAGSKWVKLYDRETLGKQSIQQLEALDHVAYIRIDREMDIIAQLDMVPRYAMHSFGIEQFGMLTDEMFTEVMEWRDDRDIHEQDRQEDRDAYLQFRKDYGIEKEAFQMSILTMDLTKENVNVLKEHLTEGIIDVDAINAGTQVLILAPELWVLVYETGGMTSFSTDSPYFDYYKTEGAFKVAWNDCFKAGQVVPLTQLYSEDAEYTNVIRNDAQVQVCGVVDSLGDLPYNSWSNCTVITTEQGLENMGLLMEGLQGVELYLDGEISLEEEEQLDRQVNAIARRSEGFSVQNHVENYRNRERANRQELLLCISVVTVFFAVAVGMIVSSVTRQLHGDGRTIGMLRAVGADEKAILGCYSGQLNAAVLGGLGITLVLVIGFIGLYALDAMRYGWQTWNNDLTNQIAIAVAIAFAMAATCWLLCKYILRLRIREIVNKSIIDIIREL